MKRMFRAAPILQLLIGTDAAPNVEDIGGSRAEAKLEHWGRRSRDTCLLENPKIR
jgi:hypothetical protein